MSFTGRYDCVSFTCWFKRVSSTHLFNTTCLVHLIYNLFNTTCREPLYLIYYYKTTRIDLFEGLKSLSFRCTGILLKRYIAIVGLNYHHNRDIAMVCNDSNLGNVWRNIRTGRWWKSVKQAIILQFVTDTQVKNAYILSSVWEIS